MIMHLSGHLRHMPLLYAQITHNQYVPPRWTAALTVCTRY